MDCRLGSDVIEFGGDWAKFLLLLGEGRGGQGLSQLSTNLIQDLELLRLLYESQLNSSISLDNSTADTSTQNKKQVLDLGAWPREVSEDELKVIMLIMSSYNHLTNIIPARAEGARRTGGGLTNLLELVLEELSKLGHVIRSDFLFQIH